MRINKTWRLRFILITSGLALGLIAKWIAGHYRDSQDRLDPDQPVRQVIESAPIPSRQHYPLLAASPLVHPPKASRGSGGEY